MLTQISFSLPYLFKIGVSVKIRGKRAQNSRGGRRLVKTFVDVETRKQKAFVVLKFLY